MITARIVEEIRDGYYTTFVVETANLFVKRIHHIQEYHATHWKRVCFIAAYRHRDYFGPNGKNYEQ